MKVFVFVLGDASGGVHPFVRSFVEYEDSVSDRRVVDVQLQRMSVCKLTGVVLE